MTVLMIVLYGLGSLAVMVGGIMLLVAAFRESVGWGFAVLFLSPIAPLIFVFSHWEEAKPGILVQLLGFCLFLGAVAVVFIEGKDSLDAAMVKFNIEQLSSGLPVQPSGGAGDEIDTGGEGPATDSQYVGMTLKEVVEILGRPEGRGEGNEVILIYPQFELISTDGVTVTSQAVPAP